MPVIRLSQKSGTGFADFSAAMTDRPETTVPPNDTDQLTKLLELELAQKRVTWKQTSERARSVRSAGFVFLFLLILACLAGAYFAFMRVNEQRANPVPSPAIGH